MAFGATVNVSGTTTTSATVTAETVTMAMPVTPFALAAIRARPGVTAVTTPLEDTVAMLVSSLDQYTWPTASARPATSTAVACRVVCRGTSRAIAEGWTRIAETA